MIRHWLIALVAVAMFATQTARGQYPNTEPYGYGPDSYQPSEPVYPYPNLNDFPDNSGWPGGGFAEPDWGFVPEFRGHGHEGHEHEFGGHRDGGMGHEGGHGGGGRR